MSASPSATAPSSPPLHPASPKPLKSELSPSNPASTSNIPLDGVEAEKAGEVTLPVTVATPGRPVVDVWGDAEAFPWAQVFSGKAEADQSGEHGVAVEPMTCPPDAFNSDPDGVSLAPGETRTLRLTIAARD